mgnify:CR=1 FL=1
MPKAAPIHKRPQLTGNATKPVRVRSHNKEYRGTAHERGYTYKWQKFSSAWLRSNPLCIYCTNQGNVALATLVDHIQPHRGDTDIFWREGNHASCCNKCHNGPKQRAENIADKTGTDIKDVLKSIGMWK